MDKYNIVKSNSLAALVTAVNEEIAKGWQPCGGVAVESAARVYETYLQAMFKKSSGGPALGPR